MKVKILLYAVCVFLIVSLQTTMLEFTKFSNIKPNIAIVFITVVSLMRNSFEGASVGLFMGLMQDIASGKLTGFYALIGLYLGVMIGVISKRLYKKSAAIVIIFTFVATLIYEIAVYLFSVAFNQKGHFLFAVKYIILPEAFYNCITSVLIYLVVKKFGKWFDVIEESSRKY